MDPDPGPQFGGGHGGQFLKAHDPSPTLDHDGRSQAGKARVDALLAKGCRDARRVEADESGLKIDHEHPVREAVLAAIDSAADRRDDCG
jgi:hypothetical protein